MKRVQGFTLIELMIAVAIAGILAAIAYPAYQDSVRKGRRTDAKAALTDLAQRLERCYTQFGTYNDAACTVSSPASSAEGFYSITAVRAAATYTLSAAPQGTQTGDARCSQFTLNNLGQRGATGSDAANCW